MQILNLKVGENTEAIVIPGDFDIKTKRFKKILK